MYFSYLFLLVGFVGAVSEAKQLPPQEAHQKLYAREEVYPKWSNFWHCQVGCDGDENEFLGCH